MHDPVFKRDEDGTITFVYHPNDDQFSQVLRQAGTLVDTGRAGHVWPRSRVLRLGFKVLRKVFGRRGVVADWTRRWGCRWVVVDHDTGEQLPGVYGSHDDAVDAEVQWSLDHGYPRKEIG
jgi:hypothetical protein